ncbi:MAG: hypothetical protein HY719_00905 [Planctomycetes bacterium]|nr:hypothetical protein [Planctomycetota bacterium]
MTDLWPWITAISLAVIALGVLSRGVASVLSYVRVRRTLDDADRWRALSERSRKRVICPPVFPPPMEWDGDGRG